MVVTLFSLMIVILGSHVSFLLDFHAKSPFLLNSPIKTEINQVFGSRDLLSMNYCLAVLVGSLVHSFVLSANIKNYTANIYLFKVDIRNTRKRSDVYSKLTIKITRMTSMTFF